MVSLQSDKAPLLISFDVYCSNVPYSTAHWDSVQIYIKKPFSTGKDCWHYPEINMNKLFNRIQNLLLTHLHLTCSVTGWCCSLISPDVTDLFLQKYPPLWIFVFSLKEHFLKCIHSFFFSYSTFFFIMGDYNTAGRVTLMLLNVLANSLSRTDPSTFPYFNSCLKIPFRREPITVPPMWK